MSTLPIDRRRLLVGAMAAIPAMGAATASSAAVGALPNVFPNFGSIPAAPAEHPDADLFRIESDFNAAYVTYEAAADKVAEAETLCWSQQLPNPVNDPMPSGLLAAFRALSLDQIREDVNHPDVVALREHEARNRHRREVWQADRDEVARRNGLPEAEAEAERLLDVLGDIAEPLLEMQARTPDGMMAKIRVHKILPFRDEDILDSLTTDISALAGATS